MISLVMANRDMALLIIRIRNVAKLNEGIKGLALIVYVIKLIFTAYKTSSLDVYALLSN